MRFDSLGTLFDSLGMRFEVKFNQSQWVFAVFYIFLFFLNVFAKLFEVKNFWQLAKP